MGDALEPSAQDTRAVHAESGGGVLRWPRGFVVAGGVVAACGAIVTGQTYWDLWGLNGAPPILSLEAARFAASLTAAGSLLTGAGFGLAFTGLASVLRRPSAALRSMSRRMAVTLVAGGLLAAAGWWTLGLLASYEYDPFPAGLITYTSLDLAARVIEAIGLAIAFIATAWAIRSS